MVCGIGAKYKTDVVVIELGYQELNELTGRWTDSKIKWFSFLLFSYAPYRYEVRQTGYDGVALLQAVDCPPIQHLNTEVTIRSTQY